MVTNVHKAVRSLRRQLLVRNVEKTWTDTKYLSYKTQIRARNSGSVLDSERERGKYNKKKQGSSHVCTLLDSFSHTKKASVSIIIYNARKAAFPCKCIQSPSNATLCVELVQCNATSKAKALLCN